MEDPQGEAGAALQGREPPPADDSVLEAQRLFATLTEQAQGQDGPRPPPTLAPAGEPPAPPPAPVVGAAPAPAGEVVALARAALTATDRLGELIELIASQGDATAADVAALAAAVEQALTATNERLASLERALLPEGAPAAEPAEWALSRLRRVAHRTGRGTRGAHAGG